MTEFNGTPGRWLLELNVKSATATILGARGDEDVRASDGLGPLVVIECATDPDAVMFSPFNTEQVANAQLMVAAPDLLEALQWMVQNDDTNEGDEENEYWTNGLNRSRAAIAKALGQ